MSPSATSTGLLVDVPRRLRDDETRVEQIVALLREVLAGLPEGAEAPSERAIAEHFGIARMTARAAVDRLVDLGLVERIPRRGTFVSRPRFVHTRHLASYDDDIRSRGLVPGGRTLSARVRRATIAVAASLGIERGDKYLDLIRLRTADGTPMAITRSQLALDRFPGIEDLPPTTGSLHDVLYERWGVRSAGHSQRIRAILVSAEDAPILQVAPGSPAFEMLGVSRDSAGVVIEVGRSVYRADRYEVILHTDVSSVSQ